MKDGMTIIEIEKAMAAINDISRLKKSRQKIQRTGSLRLVGKDEFGNATQLEVPSHLLQDVKVKLLNLKAIEIHIAETAARNAGVNL